MRETALLLCGSYHRIVVLIIVVKEREGRAMLMCAKCCALLYKDANFIILCVCVWILHFSSI